VLHSPTLPKVYFVHLLQSDYHWRFAEYFASLWKFGNWEKASNGSQCSLRTAPTCRFIKREPRWPRDFKCKTCGQLHGQASQVVQVTTSSSSFFCNQCSISACITTHSDTSSTGVFEMSKYPHDLSMPRDLAKSFRHVDRHLFLFILSSQGSLPMAKLS